MAAQITVPVPDDRIAEFYEMFSNWLKGGATSKETASQSVWGEGDLDLAASVWEKFTPAAQAIYSVLIDNPGKQFGSEALAARAGQASTYSLAGALAWPDKHCLAVNREPLQRSYALSTGGSNYWMEERVARLFRQARGMGLG